MQRMIRNLCLVLYVAGGSAAFAQSSQIPDDMLELDRQRCENDCIPAYGEAACKALCGCMVVEYKKRLTFEDYLDLTVQLSRNEISPKNRTLLDDIAKMCTKQIDDAGIQIGSPEEKPAEPSS